LIWMVAVRSEQNASTHRSRSSGIPRAARNQFHLFLSI
jgi:hypothetical protein